jgi:hypothetical protein
MTLNRTGRSAWMDAPTAAASAAGNLGEATTKRGAIGSFGSSVNEHEVFLRLRAEFQDQTVAERGYDRPRIRRLGLSPACLSQ